MSQRKSILEEDVTASPRRSTRTSRSMCDSPVPLLAKLKENFKQKIALQNDDNSSNEDSSKSSNTPVRRSTRFTSRESSVEPESTEVIPQRRVTRSMSKSPTSLSKTTGTPMRISKRKSSISDKAEIKVVLQQLDIITEIETEEKNTMKPNDQKTPKRSEVIETNENKSTDKTNILEDDGGSSETKETIEIEKNNTYDSESKTIHNTSDESQELTDKKDENQLKKDVGSIQEKNHKIIEFDEKQKENLIESTDKEIETNNLHKTDTNLANTTEEENKSSSETDKTEVVTQSTEVPHNNSTQDVTIEANRSHSFVLKDKMIESQDSKELKKNEQLVASIKSLEVEIVEKETTDSDKNKSVVVKSTTDLNLSKVYESTEKTSEEKGMEAEVNTSEELSQLKLDVSDEKTTSVTVVDLKDDQDENTSNILIVGNTASSPQSSNDDCIPKELNFNLDNSGSNKNTEEEDLNLSLVNDDGHSYSPICKLKDVPVYTENTGTPISKINDKSNSTPIKPLEKIKTPKRDDFSPTVKKSDENNTPRVTPKSKTKITKSPIVEESFEDIQPKKSGSKKRRLNSDSESDIELENNSTKKNRNVEADKLSEENMSEHEISSSDSMDEANGNKNKFIDDMAVEVSGEDTPSDGSNDIIEVGESIGSTESEIDSDESYERDSFVVEDDEASDRLLSSDDEVEKSIQASSWPHKSKRIITVSSSEDEETDNLSTQPFGGKSPSIVSVNQISSTNSDIESIKNRNEELSQMIEGVLEVKPSVPKDTEESMDSKPVDKEEKGASSNDLLNEDDLTKEVKAVKKSRLSEKSFVDIQEAVSKYIAKETNAKDKVMESKHDKSKNDNSSPGKLTESATKRKKGKNENNLEDSKLLEDFHDITNKEAEISIGNVEEMEKLELSMNMSITKDKQKQNKKEVKDVFDKIVECSTPKVVTSEKKTKLSNSGKKRNKNKIRNKDCLDETNVLKDFFDVADLTGSDLENRNEQDVNITLTSLKDDPIVHQMNESSKNKGKKRKSLENEQCDIVETVKQSSPTSEQQLSDSGRKKRRQNKNKSQSSLDDSVMLQDLSNEDECKNYVSLPVTEKVHTEITPKKQSSPTSEQPLSKSAKKKMKRNRNKSQSSLDDSVVLQDVIDEVEPKNYVKMPVTQEVNTEIMSKKASKSSRKKRRSLNKNTSEALNDSNTLKDFFKMATKENKQNLEKSPQKHDSTPTDNDNNKKKRKSLKSDSSSYDESAVGIYVLNTVSQPCNSDKNVTSEENTTADANQQIQINMKKRHRTRKMKKSSMPGNIGEILESSQTNEKSKTKTKESKRIRPRKRGSETSVEEINKQEKIIKSKKLKIESNKQQVQTELTSNLSETGHSAEKDKKKRRRLRKKNKKQSESETYTSNENLSKEGQISKENTVKNVSKEKSASSNVSDDILTKLNKKKRKQLKKSKTHDKAATNIVPDNHQVSTKKHKKEIIQSLSVKQKNVALNKTEKENVDVPRTQMNFIVMKNKNTRASLNESNNRNNTNSIPKRKNLIKPSSIGMTSGSFSVTNVEIPVVSNKLNKIKKRKTVPNTSSLLLHRKVGHINLLQECLQGPSVKWISSKEFSKLKSK